MVDSRPLRMRQRALERRQQLVALSSREIFKKGYDQFSVNDLAAAAGISVGGLYRYITTKSDLLVMACEDIYGGLLERLQQTARDTVGSEQQLRSTFALYLAACEVAKDQVILLYREYRHLPPEAQRRYKDRELRIVEFFARIITEGQDAGDFGAVDPTTVAHDMVLVGHLPALKSWALGANLVRGLAANQLEFVVAALTAGAGSNQVDRRAATTPSASENTRN